MSRALVREDLRLGDHLQVLVLLGQVLVLDHHLSDRSLLREVKLIDALLKELTVDIVQADYYLSAD